MVAGAIRVTCGFGEQKRKALEMTLAARSPSCIQWCNMVSNDSSSTVYRKNVTRDDASAFNGAKWVRYGVIMHSMLQYGFE